MNPAAVRVVFWPGKAIRRATYRVSPLLSAAGECSSGEYKGQSALPAVPEGDCAFTGFSQLHLRESELHPRESFV
jgi:hypothetical protein